MSAVRASCALCAIVALASCGGTEPAPPRAASEREAPPTRAPEPEVLTVAEAVADPGEPQREAQTEVESSFSAQDVVSAEASLAAEVRRALADDPSLSSTDISVRVQGSTVRLAGVVARPWEAGTAARIAGEVPGVERVDTSALSVP